MREHPLNTLPMFDTHLNMNPSRHAARLHVPHAPTVYRQKAAAAPVSFEAVWARDLDEVRLAQQLRHLVFVEEMGARVSLPAGTPPGHDADLFDDHCEHLLLRVTTTEGEPGPVIGTYRVLTPAAAKRVGGLYSETEFDLTRLR
ncbi:MAG: GNAT family N-acetyltransferase, partial [Actinomycetota bacterium]|nr:GNAT family N-acetyltransferase [Actinomycetota bacterium]